MLRVNEGVEKRRVETEVRFRAGFGVIHSTAVSSRLGCALTVFDVVLVHAILDAHDACGHGVAYVPDLGGRRVPASALSVPSSVVRLFLSNILLSMRKCWRTGRSISRSSHARSSSVTRNEMLHSAIWPLERWRTKRGANQERENVNDCVFSLCRRAT